MLYSCDNQHYSSYKSSTWSTASTKSTIELSTFVITTYTTSLQAIVRRDYQKSVLQTVPWSANLWTAVLNFAVKFSTTKAVNIIDRMKSCRFNLTILHNQLNMQSQMIIVNSPKVEGKLKWICFKRLQRIRCSSLTKLSRQYILKHKHFQSCDHSFYNKSNKWINCTFWNSTNGHKLSKALY